MHFYSSQSLTFERIVNLELFRVESLNTQHFQDGIVDYLTFSGWNRGILQSETMRGWKKSSHPRQWNLLHRREIIFLNWCKWMLIMAIVQVETLIEQYKKEQGNLPCKLAIACARPLSEAEVNMFWKYFKYGRGSKKTWQQEQLEKYNSENHHCLSYKHVSSD